MWILIGADAAETSPADAAARFEESFVTDQEPPASRDASLSDFQLEDMDDHLPTPKEWASLRNDVLQTITLVQDHQAQLDDTIQQASPRWRIDRMPLVDRSLLRLGAAELLYRTPPRPRATFNGLIELAKQYGEKNSPRFVNGILDEMRRALDIPFR